MERHLVHTPLGHVHLRARRDRDGIPVVLLHQSPSSSRMWLPVMAALADDVPTLAPDLLGYGESDPAPAGLGLESHAAAVHEAIAHVVRTPYLLVGHHTGAVVAAAIAEHAPADVAALLLSGYPLYPDVEAKRDRLEPVLRELVVGSEGAELLPVWRHVTGPLEPPADPDTALTIMTDRLRAGRRWFTGYEQLLATDLHELLHRAVASDPSRPTGVLIGDRDPLRHVADEVARVCGCSVTTISGTSWVSYEHPGHLRGPILELHARAGARTPTTAEAGG